MLRIVAWLLFLVWLVPADADTDQRPGRGKLLVATELVRGDIFAQTVILLLHYDETGAMGVVINRLTEIEPEEVLSDFDAVSGYSGTLYWGGPVQTNSLSALLRTDTPPQDAEAIVDSVYQVRIDDALKNAPRNAAGLRFFIGYAGWAPGQLDRELALGSWHVVRATDDVVFAEDPPTLWQRLRSPVEYRAAAGTASRDAHRLRDRAAALQVPAHGS